MDVSNPQSDVLSAFDMLKEAIRKDAEYITPFLTTCILSGDTPMRSQTLKALDKIADLIEDINEVAEKWAVFQENLRDLKPGTFKSPVATNGISQASEEVTPVEPFRATKPKNETPVIKEAPVIELEEVEPDEHANAGRKRRSAITPEEYANLKEKIRQTLQEHGGTLRPSTVRNIISAYYPQYVPFLASFEIMRKIRTELGIEQLGVGLASQWRLPVATMPITIDEIS